MSLTWPDFQPQSQSQPQDCARIAANSQPSPDMLYRIRFFNIDDELYELYAKSVYQADNMFGFLTIEDLVFGEDSQIIANPQEDKLRTEFSGTKRLFVPHHSVVMVEEVQRRGKAKIIKSEFPANKRSVVYAKEPRESG